MNINSIREKAVANGGSYSTDTFDYALLPADQTGERMLSRTRKRKEDGVTYLAEMEYFNGSEWVEM